MTEYEIADLAVSKSFELQGGVSLLQTAAISITDVIQQFMSLLFGYILAAYFIGTSLGRRQVWILTTLYIMWQAWMLTVIVGRGLGLIRINQGIQDMLGTDMVAWSRVIAPASWALLVLSLFASLYFMWTVRHPKTE
jgi:hypothetical protein